MTSLINIAGDPTDTNYRYQMHPIIGKVESRGKGRKTVLVNIAEVAKDLNRDPAHIAKFLGVELNTQFKWKLEEQCVILKGHHPDEELQALIHRFADRFCICQQCGLPETILHISKRSIQHVCAACGAEKEDPMDHKLCLHIVKMHSRKKNNKKRSKKKSKKSKRGKTNETAKATLASASAASAVYAGASSAADMSMEIPLFDEEEDDDDGKWFTDLSESAIKAREAKAKQLHGVFY